jgi:hypothetical protein
MRERDWYRFEREMERLEQAEHRDWRHAVAWQFTIYTPVVVLLVMVTYYLK